MAYLLIDPGTYFKILFPIGLFIGIRFQYLIYKYVSVLYEETDYCHKFKQFVPTPSFNEKFGVVGLDAVYGHIRQQHPYFSKLTTVFLFIFSVFLAYAFYVEGF